jgi:hypothetical protein
MILARIQHYIRVKEFKECTYYLAKASCGSFDAELRGRLLGAKGEEPGSVYLCRLLEGLLSDV